MTISKVQEVLMKLDHKLFIDTLKAHNITQKAFSEYAKIPYDTVTGWKKKGKVPAYAMVIVRDMAYRKTLNEKVGKELQRKRKRMKQPVTGLLPVEEKRIEAAFWGTNYTVAEIIEKIRSGDQKIIERFDENVPESLREKVMNMLEEYA